MDTLTPHSRDDFEILDEKTAYDGFFKVKHYSLRHKLFEGGWSQTFQREVFERQPVAAVLPYDPVLDKVVLIEQFRVGPLHSPNPWLLELVAGISEEDESTEELVKREALEEAGIEILELIKAYDYWVSPGGSNEFLSLYCGKVDATYAGGHHGNLEEHEDIKAHVLSSEKAFALLSQGEIKNAATIVSLQWLQLNKDHIFT